MDVNQHLTTIFLLRTTQEKRLTSYTLDASTVYASQRSATITLKYLLAFINLLQMVIVVEERPRAKPRT